MKLAKKTLAMLLCIVMLIGILPVSAMAATFDYAHNQSASSDGYYNVISKQDWDIAPGIKETEIVLNNAEGDYRQVVHLMEADMSNPYTRVISSYTNMDTSNYAISVIPDHAAYLENVWGENVVGIMNTCLSWYNTAAYLEDPSRVNEPLGFMMVDSEVYFDHSVGFPTCVVIHKDVNDLGEARPADIPKVQMRTVTDVSSLNGWEDQVIPVSSGFIVKDGVNQAKPSHKTDPAARSVVGIKADGSIVIMMNDGRLAPYSAGMNMYECAEVMIAAGCVYASNCDGGGSSTFMSQRPGKDLEVNCTPCDGSLRQNTHGIVFISTAPATGEFYNAYLETENDYYVPYSQVSVNAVGRDFSGAEAAIPADVVWALADSSFGTVENGVFLSNGKTGDVEIQLWYNNEIAGSKTIHVVNPEAVSFQQTSTVIPYGKSISLDIVATYGVFDVSYTADAFDFVLSDATAGSIDGLTFYGTTDTTKASVTVTATYKYADLGSTALSVSYGQGSVILHDFEDGDISNWMGKAATKEWAAVNNPDSPIFDANPFASNYSSGTDSETFLATAENGKVKNGNYALGVELDYTDSGSYGQWTYDMFFNVEGQTVLRDVANGQNATRFGMWIYIPEELAPGHNLAMQTEFYTGTSAENVARKNTHLVLDCNGKTLTKCTEADIPEDRWVYCYMDLTPYNYVSFQNPYTSTAQRREPQFIRFYTAATEPFKAVLYLDDMTLDYSSAVEDRNAPVITNPMVNTSGTGIRSFNANVADYAASNTSGLNYASANIYVDGVALSGVKASGGTISAPDMFLLGGAHTVTFEIADNMGNVTKESVSFNVEGDAPVAFAGHNDLNNVPVAGSVYYVDIDVQNVENINSVTTDIQLNHANDWELDHMTVADGFTATYTLNKYHNTASVTVTKVDSDDTGAATLVSIPVRVWSFDEADAGFAASTIDANSYPLVLVKAAVKKALVAFADGTTGTFNGSLNVATDMTTSVLPSAWHIHTAEAVADKAVTCTEDGYTGRTYCNVCGSVVEWGAVTKATGHDWQLNAEGKLACANNPEELYTGIWEGQEYVDGVVLADGWVEIDGVKTYYYLNGVKLTGTQLIDGLMCTFDDDGVYQANADFTGFYTTEDGKYMYIMSNVPQTGYQRLMEVAYYFDEDGYGYEGTYTVGGYECLFEDGQYVSCADANVILAGWAGVDVEFILTADGVLTLSGSGDTFTREYRGLMAWNDHREMVKKVIIGKDITSLGSHVFSHMYNLASVEFAAESKLTSIGNFTFHYARALRSVVLPDLVSKMGSSSFGYCKNLTVTLPDQISNIHKNAFTKSTGITLNVAEGSYAEDYAKTYGFTYETRATKYGPADIRPGEDPVQTGAITGQSNWSLYSGGRLLITGTGAIPSYSSTSETPWYAYRNEIKAVKIGKGITSIGNNAFAHLYKLAHVVFEEDSQLTALGDHAFHYAMQMESIVIPDGVKSYGYSALGYCRKLVDVQMSEGASVISGWTFWNHNENLTVNVVAGSKAETFAKNQGIAYTTRDAKYGSADVLPGETAVETGTCGPNAIWSFYEDGRLVVSGSGAIDNYTSKEDTPWAQYRAKVKSVKIGKDITVVGHYAFAHMYNLGTVVFEEGSQLTTLGDHAFHYASQLKSIVIPDGVTYYDYSALGYCAKLVDVQMSEGASVISNWAFWNHNENLTVNVVAGSKAETFAKNQGIAYTTRDAKYGANDILPGEQALASGTCGENAKWAVYTGGRLVISGSGAIDNYASREDTPWAAYRGSIKSVKIGKDITAIGNYAFGHMYNLASVSFEEGSKLTTLGDHAFHYASRLKSIVIPDGVTFYDYSALGYCAVLVDVQMSENASIISAWAFWNHNPNLVLNVVKGSKAETFALNNGIAVTYR